MASLDVSTHYLMQLTPDEFALVNKALTATMDDTDRKEAVVLHSKFMATRARSARLAADACARALTRAEALVSVLNSESPARGQEESSAAQGQNAQSARSRHGRTHVCAGLAQ